MADRVLETMPEEVPELPDLLEKVLIFALEEMKEKLEQGQDIIPFSCLVVKDNLFMESHPGDTPEQCFADARHTVEGARGAEAYAMGYDGYIETDEGVKDALIAEGGLPGEDAGHAIGYHTVEGARGAEAYAMGYDGYIETDEGVKDALIAEGGLPGEDAGHAIGYLYTIDDEGNVTFADEAAYIGEAPNFMEGLKAADEYAEDEMDQRFVELEDDGEGLYDPDAEEAPGYVEVVDDGE